MSLQLLPVGLISCNQANLIEEKLLQQVQIHFSQSFLVVK